MNLNEIYSKAAAGQLTTEYLHKEFEQLDPESNEDLAHALWLQNEETKRFLEYLESTCKCLILNVCQLSNLDQTNELRNNAKELETITKVINYARSKNFSATS